MAKPVVFLSVLSPKFRGKGASTFSPSHPLLPLRQKQQKTVQGEDPPGKASLPVLTAAYPDRGPPGHTLTVRGGLS